MALSDDALLDRMFASMRFFCSWLPQGSPGARVVERDGVMAAVVPVVPDRSVFNSVMYDDPAALEDALPEVAGAYDEAGVRAWTVWVPERDAAARALLERSGHVLDADPAAMVLELDQFERPDIGDLDWSSGDVATLADLNDRSYRFSERPFAKAFESFPDDAMHTYLASFGGAPASCLGIQDHNGDSVVEFVATIPDARGRGLAGRLLAQALVDARERGCTTSTLQATKQGEPVYARLGYRTIGRLEMWERRKPQ